MDAEGSKLPELLEVVDYYLSIWKTGTVWLEMQYRYASAPNAKMRMIWEHAPKTRERVGWKNDEKYREDAVAALQSWVGFAEWKASQTDSEENATKRCIDGNVIDDPQRATSTRPPSRRDRIREQRLKFIKPRIAKEETWQAIYFTIRCDYFGRRTHGTRKRACSNAGYTSTTC